MRGGLLTSGAAFLPYLKSSPLGGGGMSARKGSRPGPAQHAKKTGETQATCSVNTHRRVLLSHALGSFCVVNTAMPERCRRGETDFLHVHFPPKTAL